MRPLRFFSWRALWLKRNDVKRQFLIEIYKLIHNVLKHNLKYSNPEVDPVISISSRKINNVNQFVFSDNGIGFDMDEAENKIFGLHQSFHNNRDSKGIGLYLVQSHLQSLGEKITVERKMNIGTTFTMTFKN